MFTAKSVTLILTYISSLIGIFSISQIASIYITYISLLVLIGSLINDIKFNLYIPKTVLISFGFIFSIFTASKLSLDNLFNPLSDILLILLCIKFLEEKKERDIYQILIINLVALSISSIYNIDITFAIYTILFAILGTTIVLFLNLSKYSLNIPIDKKTIKSFLFASMFLFITTAFISIPMFILLPRTPQPMFALAEGGHKPSLKTGISEKVEIGKIGEIQKDNSVVLRVTDINLKGITPYWRVKVFDTYKNGKWITTIKEKSFKKRKKEGIRYTIILNPHGEKYIPLLDYPESILSVKGNNKKYNVFKGNFYELEKPLTSPLKIEATYIERIEESISWKEYEKLTNLPQYIPTEIIEIAKSIEAKSKSPEEIIENIKLFFSDFEYTMKLENYTGDPLVYFLTVSKKGNCEYFASATALILRAMNIPARVVGGFKGAIKNPNIDYYIVTNSMAHVWVEAFINGKWVRIDTTPPYTPPSIRNISRLTLLKDSIIFFWYSNIVNFSTSHQYSIVKNISNINIAAKNLVNSLKNISYIKLIVILLIILLPVLIVIYIKNNNTKYIYIKLKNRLSDKLALDLVDKTPTEILDIVKGSRLYDDVSYIVNLYLKERFSNKNISKEEIKEAKKRLKNI